MPDVYHCFYDGKGTHDVFVLGNLLAEDYENFDETKDFDEDHLKSLLECLAQLHGTGKDYLVIGPIFVDSTFLNLTSYWHFFEIKSQISQTQEILQEFRCFLLLQQISDKQKQNSVNFAPSLWQFGL